MSLRLWLLLGVWFLVIVGLLAKAFVNTLAAGQFNRRPVTDETMAKGRRLQRLARRIPPFWP
jgi:hypothetical protein